MLSDSKNSPGQINILNVKSRLMNLDVSMAVLKCMKMAISNCTFSYIFLLPLTYLTKFIDSLK